MLEEEGKNKTKTTKAKLQKAKARFTPDIVKTKFTSTILQISVIDLAGQEMENWDFVQESEYVHTYFRS